MGVSCWWSRSRMESQIQDRSYLVAQADQAKLGCQTRARASGAVFGGGGMYQWSTASLPTPSDSLRVGGSVGGPCTSMFSKLLRRSTCSPVGQMKPCGATEPFL